MYELALAYGNGPVSIKSITDKQNISENYLEQLFGFLKKANLVIGHRGAQGGYILKKAPSSITVGDIVRAFEGSISLCECLEDNKCEHLGNCATHLVWERLKDSMIDVLDSTTLEDMVKSKF